MPFCRFCFDNKIDGPHNHYLRESKDPSSRVICPLLLNTLCLNCNKRGHTANYCRVKEIQIKVNMEKEYDDDGFMIIKSRNQKTNKEEREYMENKNNFAILCEDIDNVELEKREEKVDPFAKRPIGMSWADWEEMDD
jgi:hypothetical protein